MTCKTDEMVCGNNDEVCGEPMKSYFTPLFSKKYDFLNLSKMYL